MRKLTMMIIAMFVLTSFLITSITTAENQIDNIVNAHFDIVLKDATNFEIDVYMDVIQVTAFGETYDNGDVKNLVTSTNSDDKEALGVVKNYLHESLFEQISNIFGNDAVSALINKPLFENNQFTDMYSVNLTYTFFNINKTIDAYKFVNGAFDMGANITYNLELYAKDGWNDTYVFILPENIGLSYANTTTVSLDTTHITWALSNYNGNDKEENAVLRIHDKYPTFEQSEGENIYLNFKINAVTPKTTSLDINTDVHSADVRSYNVVPSFIENLRYISSDGIRLFIENKLFSWDEFKEKTLDNVRKDIVEKIETNNFNESTDLKFSWDNQTTTQCLDKYEIKKMDTSPPIKTSLIDEKVGIRIYNNSLQAIFGLINSGAKINLTEGCINFGEKISEIGYNYNVSLYMPEGIKIQNQNPYVWNDTIELDGDALSESSPNYIEEEKNTIIEIEIENTDLNLLSFFTGDPELSFGMKMTQEKAYNVTKIPDNFKLSEKIEIGFLNSDALRVCIQEGVFDQDSVDNFLTNDKDDFEKIAKHLIKNIDVSGNINQKDFEESLEWDEDITNMDSEKPVKTVSYSYTSQPSKFDVSIVPPGIKIPRQKYNFTGIENQTVTYRIIFPSGININVDDNYDKTVIKKTKDERSYLEITFTPEESDMSVDVNCDISPSAFFVIGLFTPCIISIFITLILLVVLITLRKKRGGRIKPTKQREPAYEEKDTGYQDQDYYIPPPPSSK